MCIYIYIYIYIHISMNIYMKQAEKDIRSLRAEWVGKCGEACKELMVYYYIMVILL